MEFYYIVPEIEELIAYTTNPYLFNLYIDQLKEFGIKDGIYLTDHGEYKTEIEFLEIFGEILTHAGFTIHYGITRDHKLYSIKDQMSDQLMVINRTTYDSFISDFTTFQEYRKILANYYARFNPRILSIYRYMKNIDDLINLSRMVYDEYYPKLRSIREYSTFDLYVDLDRESDSKLWEICNEYHLIRYYLELNIKTSTFGYNGSLTKRLSK